MGAIVSILLAAAKTIVLPMVLKAAADGTLMEIIGLAITLIQKLIPLTNDPHVKAALQLALKDILAMIPRPAQPEDPSMGHAAGNDEATGEQYGGHGR